MKSLVVLRWPEFDRNDRLAVKVREFKSEKTLSTFASKPEQKGNFNEIEAYGYIND